MQRRVSKPNYSKGVTARNIRKRWETSRKEKNGDGRRGGGDTFTAVFAVVKWWTYTAVIIVFLVTKSYHTSCIAHAWIAEARSLFQQIEKELLSCLLNNK